MVQEGRVALSETGPAADSIPAVQDGATDSVAVVVVEPARGILLTPPEEPVVILHNDESTGMSVIFGSLALLFCVIGLRFRNNRKYMTALWHNLTEVRMRTNVFDDTVRESSFMMLLNILWGCSAGILLWGAMNRFVGFPALGVHPAGSMAVCMAVATVYDFAMTGCYWCCGLVFSDRKETAMWVKGFTSSQGLTSLPLLPVALVLLFYPQYGLELLWIGAGIVVTGKLMFIWKGIRIFSGHGSSWMLFLYYLCSLEIVPLILTYTAAMGMCNLL